MFETADRLKNVAPHLSAEIDRKKRERIAQGADVIDLGVGDTDLGTHPDIVEACKKALEDPKNHKYPFQVGSPNFRRAISSFLDRRFGVNVAEREEVIPLIGSKEGIGHFILAFVNPGDYVLLPDPGYPVYNSWTQFAGGRPYEMPLLRENNFLPELAAVPEEVLKKTRLMILNYPNNPTSSLADIAYFDSVSSLAKKFGFIVLHDAAYTELYFDETPPSFLQARYGREVGIEFHSLSKSFCMTGWRTGFAVGNETLISGLTRMKNNIDTGTFLALQEAGAFALDHIETILPPLVQKFKKRKNVIVDGLRKGGFDVFEPKATIYVWCATPPGTPSLEFAERLLDEAAVVVTPGRGLGTCSEGYFRISLTSSESVLAEAAARICRCPF